ncbi:MAG: hypothetical protein AB7P69_22875 [Candidatus Binatia bacterium]
MRSAKRERRHHTAPKSAFSSPQGRLPFVTFVACVVALLLLVLAFLAVNPSSVLAQYPPSYLGISLSELENALGKVNGPVSFAPRPGSDQGTLEAKLPENAGIVQTAGSPGNLGVVVLWISIEKGKFASASSRAYLGALMQLLTNESGPILRWIEQVLERAVAESGAAPYLESQLLEERQFKVTYLPTFSLPMLSLTVTGGGQGAPR